MKSCLILILTIVAVPVCAQACNYRVCANQKYTGLCTEAESLIALSASEVAEAKAKLQEGYSLRPVIMPRPAFGGVSSEGAYRTLATQLQELGVTGVGTKIGVIDVGFKGITGIAAGEISSFKNTLNHSGLNFNYGKHGTACLEVLREIAPDAEIYVYRLGGLITESVIAQQIISDGIDIVCSSLAWLGYPENGPVCDAARTLIAAGIPWVNASGNWANGGYWESESTLLDNSGYILFGSSNLNLLSNISNGIEVGFSFEAPNASYARYNTELLENTGSGFTVISSTKDDYYFQYLSLHPVSGASYALRVRQTQPGITGRMRIQTFINRLSKSDTQGSISNPGAIPDVITVGAVHQSNYSSFGVIEDYSSQGGGIWNLKIDACAPTGCRTLSYGGPFTGTSCAAPNIAGLMLLMVQQGISPKNAFAALDFTDIMSNGFDDLSGHGIVIAPKTLSGLPYFIGPRRSNFPEAKVGDSIYQPLLADQSVVAYTLVAGALPTGLLIDSSTGVISGILSSDADYTFSVQLTDSDGDINQAEFSWSVSPTGSLHISQPASTFLSSILAGQATAIVFGAENTSGLAVWMHSGGRIPPGLFLDSTTGKLIGSPVIAGEYSFTIRVTDGQANTTERIFIIAVDGPSPLNDVDRSFSGCSMHSGHSWPALLFLMALTAMRFQQRKRARRRLH